MENSQSIFALGLKDLILFLHHLGYVQYLGFASVEWSGYLENWVPWELAVALALLEFVLVEVVSFGELSKREEPNFDIEPCLRHQ